MLTESPKLNIRFGAKFSEFIRFLISTFSAQTYFGARHGLETLSQLITFDSENTLEEDLHIPSEVYIKDEPMYPYRGLLLDTSRNYYSIGSIKV